MRDIVSACELALFPCALKLSKFSDAVDGLGELGNTSTLKSDLEDTRR